METQIFHHAKIYQSSKIPLKETKILQDTYYNSVTNLTSFNTSQNIIFQKSSYKNRAIIYYLGAYKNLLSYYILL
jgi:hypothetical protein